MGAGQSQTDIGGSSCGYHVLRVQPNSPGSKAGLQAYFDFILAAGNTRFDKENGAIREILKASIDQRLKMLVYNTRSKKTREVDIVPSTTWGGNGLLGVSIKHASFDRIDEKVWHVLEVQPGSPAQQAGLLSNDDYVIGSDSVLQESEDLYNLIQTHEGKALKLFIYNVVTDSCREVICNPNSRWGGEGSLGCEFGHGYLHRIPYKERDEEKRSLLSEDRLHSTAMTRSHVQESGGQQGYFNLNQQRQDAPPASSIGTSFGGLASMSALPPASLVQSVQEQPNILGNQSLQQREASQQLVDLPEKQQEEQQHQYQQQQQHQQQQQQQQQQESSTMPQFHQYPLSSYQKPDTSNPHHQVADHYQHSSSPLLQQHSPSLVQQQQQKELSTMPQFQQHSPPSYQHPDTLNSHHQVADHYQQSSSPMLQQHCPNSVQQQQQHQQELPTMPQVQHHPSSNYQHPDTLSQHHQGTDHYQQSSSPMLQQHSPNFVQQQGFSKQMPTNVGYYQHPGQYKLTSRPGGPPDVAPNSGNITSFEGLANLPSPLSPQQWLQQQSFVGPYVQQLDAQQTFDQPPPLSVLAQMDSDVRWRQEKDEIIKQQRLSSDTQSLLGELRAATQGKSNNEDSLIGEGELEVNLN